MSTEVSGKSVEKVLDLPGEPGGLALSPNGTLHIVIPQQGSILRIAPNGDADELVNTGGVPTNIAFDASNFMYICDVGHQALLTFSADRGLAEFVREYEGRSLKGPYDAVFDSTGNLYFTDSGPFGDTNLERPYGSLFSITADGQLLQPLVVDRFAGPTGIAISPDDSVLYIAESFTNRLIRMVQHPKGAMHASLFHQFSGLLGPCDVAVDNEGFIYVARYDLAAAPTRNGIISVLSPTDGSIVLEYIVPGPTITGIQFDREKQFLFIAEATTQSLYRCPALSAATSNRRGMGPSNGLLY